MTSLLLVHAHPDDESLFTALLTLKAKQRGWWVTLLTMTNGALGFDPQSRDAFDPQHDRGDTIASRHSELLSAAGILGIDELIHQGFQDSGMAGWATNHEPGALSATPVAEVGRIIGETIDACGAEIVVTYGSDGFYGHPDHLACYRGVVAALEQRPCVALMTPVVERGRLETQAAALEGRGYLLPDWLGGGRAPGVDAQRITGSVESNTDVLAKRRALACHRSQSDNEIFSELEDEAFSAVLGEEFYEVLAWGDDRSRFNVLSILEIPVVSLHHD